MIEIATALRCLVLGRFVEPFRAVGGRDRCESATGLSDIRRCNRRAPGDESPKLLKAGFAPTPSSGVAGRCDLAEPGELD